jgi:hypothetical protein
MTSPHPPSTLGADTGAADIRNRAESKALEMGGTAYKSDRFSVLSYQGRIASVSCLRRCGAHEGKELAHGGQG